MDLRAWKETEAKATSLHANLTPESKLSANSVRSNLIFQHTDEYENEKGSPSKGIGSGPMPVLQPEDDWVEELPRPIAMPIGRPQIQAEED